MPNTFPQWWGHQEFQHPDRNVAAEKKVTAEKKITAEPITRTSTLWVPCISYFTYKNFTLTFFIS
jgi:hypothetical protein